jgi:hypothetical protein
VIRSLPPKEKKKIRNLEKSLFQKIGENRGIFPKSFLIFWKNARISRKKCNLPKYRLLTKLAVLVAVPAVVAHNAPLPPCCVYPVKLSSKVDKSTNEEGGKAMIIFPR